MKCAIGEIVLFHSEVAGYPKYHVCVRDTAPPLAAAFLYINSQSGYAGDLVLADGEIAGLPASRTGETVISCSQLIFASSAKLIHWKAEKIGTLSPAVAKKLHTFAKTVTTLTNPERQIVLIALAKLI